MRKSDPNDPSSRQSLHRRRRQQTRFAPRRQHPPVLSSCYETQPSGLYNSTFFFCSMLAFWKICLHVRRMCLTTHLDQLVTLDNESLTLQDETRRHHEAGRTQAKTGAGLDRKQRTPPHPICYIEETLSVRCAPAAAHRELQHHSAYEKIPTNTRIGNTRCRYIRQVITNNLPLYLDSGRRRRLPHPVLVLRVHAPAGLNFSRSSYVLLLQSPSELVQCITPAERFVGMNEMGGGTGGGGGGRTVFSMRWAGAMGGERGASWQVENISCVLRRLAELVSEAVERFRLPEGYGVDETARRFLSPPEFTEFQLQSRELKKYFKLSKYLLPTFSSAAPNANLRGLQCDDIKRENTTTDCRQTRAGKKSLHGPS